MPARHYNLEYNVNSGPWLSGILDETPGPGKQLAISGLSVGTYAVKLRMVPLSGDTTPIVSNEVIMQVGTPAITEPVFTTADSNVTLADVVQRRDTLLAAAGVEVTAADAQVMNEALLSTASESGSVITGFVDTVTALGSTDASVATVQTMLEQVVAAITAADNSASAATRVEAASTSADVISSQTDTVTTNNSSPTFTAQPSLSSATINSITITYGTNDAEGDHYKRETSFNGGTTWYQGTVEDETPGAGQSVAVTGLSAGTSYDMRLKLTPLTGNVTPVLSNIVAMITLCAAPSLSATAGNAQNTLTMSATGAASYNVYYTSDGSTPTLASTKISGVSSPYVHGSLTNGTTYKYAATAVNAGGESALSTVVSATPSAYPTTLTNGATVSTAPFGLTALVASSGSLVQTATDTFVINDNSTLTQGASLYNTAAWSGAYTHRIKVSGLAAATSTNLWMVVKDAASGAPAIGNTTAMLANRKFRFGIAEDGSANQGKVYVAYLAANGSTENFLQSNGTWSTSLVFIAPTGGGMQLQIQRDASNYTLTVLNADGSAITGAVGVVPISSVYHGSNDDYWMIGDNSTDSYGVATIQIIS